MWFCSWSYSFKFCHSKNSNNAKYVSKAVANVKNHPPIKTTIKPKIPISNPL